MDAFEPSEGARRKKSCRDPFQQLIQYLPYCGRMDEAMYLPAEHERRVSLDVPVVR